MPLKMITAGVKVLDLSDTRFHRITAADYVKLYGKDPPSIPGQSAKDWVPVIAPEQFRPCVIRQVPTFNTTQGPLRDENEKVFLSVSMLVAEEAYRLNYWPGHTITNDSEKLKGESPAPVRVPADFEDLMPNWFPGAPWGWADVRSLPETQEDKQTGEKGQLDRIEAMVTEIFNKEMKP